MLLFGNVLKTRNVSHLKEVSDPECTLCTVSCNMETFSSTDLCLHDFIHTHSEHKDNASETELKHQLPIKCFVTIMQSLTEKVSAGEVQCFCDWAS